MTAAATDPQSDEAIEPAFAAAATIARRNAGGFYYVSYFVPKPKRRATFAVYAFCCMIREALRLGDHAINTGTGLREHPAVVSPRHLGTLPPPPTDESAAKENELETRLAMFRDRLTEIYDGKLELPAVASRSEAQHALEAFRRTTGEFAVPKQYFLDLAEGCRMEASVTRFATWTGLRKYCDNVSGVIAEIIGSVLGFTHSDGHKKAMQLGEAIRLTSILRNIRADRDLGKIYLPLEDLARFRYSQQDLAAGIVNEPFRELMKFEIARAHQLFEESADGISWLADDGTRLAVSAIVASQMGQLHAIERQHYDVFAGPPTQSPAEKFRQLPAAWRLARRRAGEPMPRTI